MDEFTLQEPKCMESLIEFIKDPDSDHPGTIRIVLVGSNQSRKEIIIEKDKLARICHKFKIEKDKYYKRKEPWENLPFHKQLEKEVQALNIIGTLQLYMSEYYAD